MPLRDHFRPPLADKRSWEGFHGGWPMMIVEGLNQGLPRGYVAEPQGHIGSSIEIDVATFDESEEPGPSALGGQNLGATTATLWAPPLPTLAVVTEPPSRAEYAVRVYDARTGRRLVAAVEIVSPANKDRPEHRRAFVTKCAVMLQEGVCVAIVDIVTSRGTNLYRDLMDLLGQTDPSIAEEPASLSAVSGRWARESESESWRLETWLHPLTLGQPLPTLPVWIAENLAVPLELEISYEETCRVLRIA